MTQPTTSAEVVLAGKSRRLRYTAAALIRVERANPDALGYVERTILLLWEGLSKEDKAEFGNSMEEFAEAVTIEELTPAQEGAASQMKADSPEPTGNPPSPAVNQ